MSMGIEISVVEGDAEAFADAVEELIDATAR